MATYLHNLSLFRAKEKQNLIAELRAADWRVWGPDGAAVLPVPSECPLTPQKQPLSYT